MIYRDNGFWIQWDRHLSTYRAGIGDDVSTCRGHRSNDYLDPEVLATLFGETLTAAEVLELTNDKTAGQS